MKSECLRLEIQQDGHAAGLYSGRLLVIGFKWKEAVKAYEIIGSTREWEDLIIHNKTLQYYLNRVLEVLEAYRVDASRLAGQRKAAEDSLSGFLCIGE